MIMFLLAKSGASKVTALCRQNASKLLARSSSFLCGFGGLGQCWQKAGFLLAASKVLAICQL
jgi:hypothetical protein